MGEGLFISSWFENSLCGKIGLNWENLFYIWRTVVHTARKGAHFGFRVGKKAETGPWVSSFWLFTLKINVIPGNPDKSTGLSNYDQPIIMESLSFSSCKMGRCSAGSIFPNTPSLRDGNVSLKKGGSYIRHTKGEGVWIGVNWFNAFLTHRCFKAFHRLLPHLPLQ